MPDSFRSIRPWENSRDRAFEEICYQLLREPEDLPPNMQGLPVRTGNPDGGVEWYARTGDGGEWGWQAKYIYDIGSLLKGMTKTVERVTKERPKLTRLTFCIPTNLSAGTAGGRQTPGDKRYTNQVAAWKDKITGADKIEFVLKQGSDLLDRLALPQHAGRAWFWWNEPYLGPDWLAGFLRQQVDVAGDRYRPVLQVDLPIQEDLSALGFADSYFNELNRHTRLAVERLNEVKLPSASFGGTIVNSTRVVLDLATQLKEFARSADYQAELGDPLNELDHVVDACISALSEAQEQAHTVQRSSDTSAKVKGKPSDAELLRYHSYDLSRAANALSLLKDFLDNSASRAVRERFYFLTGSAGTGKTHLCLDSVQRALDENRPALVLFGTQFGAGDLWTSICDQLGLPPLGANVLLGALEAVAEASGIHGRRFVIMVDALNDTKAEDYWASRLPTLRASFAARPLLSLLVSCRDTYLDYIDPEDRYKTFRRAHPGFAGREVEATQKYFQQYGLRAPKIPLLVPEFTVPLFLLTYCEGLKGEGLTAPPAGHEGRIEIFERFLQVELKRVTRKLSLPPGSSKVRAALDALLDEMSASGSEYIPFDRAEALTLQQVPERTEWPRTALGALLSEGLLNDERIYMGDSPTEAVRVTYQAFSDFLILQRRLADTPWGSAPDKAFAEWLEKASWGVREAAALLLPERHGIELPDMLEPVVRERVAANENPRLTQNRLDNLDGMAVGSLPYRRPEAIGDRAIEILNRHARGAGGIKALLDVTFLCSPQPDSPLNGARLHEHLSKFSMPDRDLTMGMALYHEIWEESSPLSRLARWAADGPYPEYEAEVVELACIPLVWMFSSPNRYARDWITKALAQLLAGHLDVAARLVERFAAVNDPYVLERLVNVAYGAVLRGGLIATSQATRLASVTERLIFDRLSELVPDALMIDAARGIIEWAAVHGLLPESSLSAARLPYGFKPPGNPPTKERLKVLYPHGQGTTDKTSYGSIFISVLDYGDFGRYVIESGTHHFLKVPLSKPRPLPELPKEPQFLVTHWNRFLRSLSPGQRERAEALSELPEGPTLVDALQEFHTSLTKRQSELLGKCWRRSKRRSPLQELGYPAERAQRWVLRRTMTLGWTPKRFGSFDRYLNRGDAGRSSHKNERFGKKYQWIAYHELLARIADNYHFGAWYEDEPDKYMGLYQINDREIDASLPPVPYGELQERVPKQGTWPPLTIDFRDELPGRIDFAAYGADYHAFLEDYVTLPWPERIARITDRLGRTWLILYAQSGQNARASEIERPYDGDEQFYNLNSWLVARGNLATAVKALPGELKRESPHLGLMDSGGHIDCCYFGELGWLDVGCPHRYINARTLIPEENAVIQGFATTEDYTWEGSIWDCSIEDSVHALLPSAYLQQSAGLQWDGNSRSWLSEGDPVICNIELGVQRANANLLVAREDWLQTFLKDCDLAIIYGVKGERQHRDGPPEEYEWLEFNLSGAYDSASLTHGESETAHKRNQR